MNEAQVNETLGKLVGFYSGVIATLVEALDVNDAIDGYGFAQILREGKSDDLGIQLANGLADVIEARLDRRDPPPPPTLRLVE